MSIKIDSMKRLYEAGKITKEQIAERVKTNKLTKDEYATITGEEYTE